MRNNKPHGLDLILLVGVLLFTQQPQLIAQTPSATSSPQLNQAPNLTPTAVKLYNEENYDAALPLAKRALELGQASLGDKNPGLIGLLINLGNLYVATMKFADAGKCFEQALKIGETNFGLEDKRLTRAKFVSPIF